MVSESQEQLLAVIKAQSGLTIAEISERVGVEKDGIRKKLKALIHSWHSVRREGSGTNNDPFRYFIVED